MADWVQALALWQQVKAAIDTKGEDLSARSNPLLILHPDVNLVLVELPRGKVASVSFDRTARTIKTSFELYTARLVNLGSPLDGDVQYTSEAGVVVRPTEIAETFLRKALE